jgi:hypothetical protein
MARTAHHGPPRRSSLALSFAWLAALPRLLRFHATSMTGGPGALGDPEPLVPVYCPQDTPRVTVWVPRAAVGSVFCSNRDHWGMPMEEDRRAFGESS